MRKLISFGFILIIILSLFPVTSYADGMTFGVDRGISRLLNEEHQFCAISYKDGYQNMILSINTEKSTFKNGVWLFPVPAKPESVKLNIVKGFPDFHGNDMKEAAMYSVSEAFGYMRLSQLYTMPFFLSGTLSSKNADSSVKIYDTVNKMGVSTEVISAADIASLTDYLEKKGMKIESSYRSTLNSYLGKDYSFVVSWIYDESKLLEEQHLDDYSDRSIINNLIGVNIAFPSKKLFFPLKPTAIYGDRTIPAVIYIEGFVTPDVYNDIKSFTKTRYFKGRIRNNDLISNNFFESKNGMINYTKVEIDSPSKLFTDDLWIEKAVPVKVRIYENINNSIGIIIFVILFLIISCVSGVISGIASFKRHKIPKYKFILLGLCNTFSIIGVLIASFKMKLREIDKKGIESIKISDNLILKDNATNIRFHILIASIIFVLVCFCLKFEIYVMFIFLTFIAPILWLYQITSLSTEKPDSNQLVLEKEMKIINTKKRRILLISNSILVVFIMVTLFNINYISDIFDNYFYRELFDFIYFAVIYILNLIPILVIYLKERACNERLGDLKVLKIEFKAEEKMLFSVLFSLIFVGITILLQVIVYIALP